MFWVLKKVALLKRSVMNRYKVSRLFVLCATLFFFEKLYLMEEQTNSAQELDNFSSLITEMKTEIIDFLMPYKDVNVDEFIASLQAMSNLAATNHQNYEVVCSDYFSKKIKAVMYSFASGEQCIEVAEKIKDIVKKPGILLIFNIQEIVNQIIQIERKNQEVIRLSVQDGLNVNFEIEGYHLMHYIDLDKEPELALQLFEKGAQLNDTYVTTEHFNLSINKYKENHTYKKLFKCFIEKGTNANRCFLWRQIRRPLLWYAFYEFDYDLDLIELLLQKGANARLPYISKPGMYRDEMSTPWQDAEKIHNTRPEVLALIKRYS